MTAPDLAIGLPFIVSGFSYLAWLIWREWRGHGTEAECGKQQQAAQLREEMRK